MLDLSNAFNLIDYGVAQGIFPGACACVGNREGIILSKRAGLRQLFEKDEPVELDTLFDLASLTKVTATMPVIMQLVQKGIISLFDFVFEYLPDFKEDKNLKIINLLTHTSGFEPFSQLSQKCSDFSGAIEYIASSKRICDISSRVLYSDYNFIVLQGIIEKVTGQAFENICTDLVFKALGMNNTCFNPRYNDNIAATEFDSVSDKYLKGIVHDENARFFNGVSGHAGLFSNIYDLSKYCRMYLNEGKIDKDRSFFSKSTIECITHNYTADLGESRGLGFCIKKNGENSSAGELISEGSYGHTGFTGTSIWIDNKLSIYIILLTNRIHPNRNNDSIIRFRRLFHNAVTASFSK